MDTIHAKVKSLAGASANERACALAVIAAQRRLASLSNSTSGRDIIGAKIDLQSSRARHEQARLRLQREWDKTL